MAAPALSQVLAMDAALKKIYENAITEFMDTITPEMTVYEVREVAVAIAAKYRRLGSELGALWYDVCAELAGLRLEPAELLETTAADLERRLEKSTTVEEYKAAFKRIIYDAMRETGKWGMWRDFERGLAPGKWARVPTGDTTCAWCLMLASNGAWYISAESALGGQPTSTDPFTYGGKEYKSAQLDPAMADHYHDNCDCIAVYYANAEDIEGYDAFYDYKTMYYEADQARRNGNYSQEVADRIEKARKKHEEDYEAGRTDIKWTEYNETMIVMREMYGLK